MQYIYIYVWKCTSKSLSQQNDRPSSSLKSSPEWAERTLSHGKKQGCSSEKPKLARDSSSERDGKPLRESSRKVAWFLHIPDAQCMEYLHDKFQPNVGKYTIHGSYGYVFCFHVFVVWIILCSLSFCLHNCSLRFTSAITHISWSSCDFGLFQFCFQWTVGATNWRVAPLFEFFLDMLGTWSLHGQINKKQHTRTWINQCFLQLSLPLATCRF